MTVRELNRDQLHELKQAYYSELEDDGYIAVDISEQNGKDD